MINERRHSFARSAIFENLSRRDQDLSEFLQNNRNFENPNLKLKGVAIDNSQVTTAYYSTETKHQSKHGKHAIEGEEETKSRSSIASDF